MASALASRRVAPAPSVWFMKPGTFLPHYFPAIKHFSFCFSTVARRTVDGHVRSGAQGKRIQLAFAVRVVVIFVLQMGYHDFFSYNFRQALNRANPSVTLKTLHCLGGGIVFMCQKKQRYRPRTRAYFTPHFAPKSSGVPPLSCPLVL